MDWNKIFSPDLFIEDMITREEIYREEIEEGYGRAVCSLCHNSVAWMYLRILTNFPELLDNLFLVTGSFNMGLSIKLDHSWVEYRKDNKIVALDLTLSQFRIVKDRLYVGEKIKQLNEWESVCFNSEVEMKRLLLSL